VGRGLTFARSAVQESIARVRPGSASRVLDANLSCPPLGGAWKRRLDVATAGAALLVLVPLMLATAILVRILTGKSIILCERLIGLRGRTFVGYRFRIPVTKATTSGWASGFAVALRALSLDKLPQLFNVLRGDMSLVGPRPRTQAEFSYYVAQAAECLLARPGFIGIDERYEPARDQQREIVLDRYYVRHWSARLDFELLGKAIFRDSLGYWRSPPRSRVAPQLDMPRHATRSRRCRWH
jgi:exopolysaccharide production protein ExoY